MKSVLAATPSVCAGPSRYSRLYIDVNMSPAEFFAVADKWLVNTGDQMSSLSASERLELGVGLVC